MVGEKVRFSKSKEEEEIGIVKDKVRGILMVKGDSKLVDYYVVEDRNGKIYPNILPWRIYEILK